MRKPRSIGYWTKINRRRGHLPIDEVQFASIKKGRAAERIVESFFKDQGFATELTTCNGPDLFVSKNDIRFTVEVKSISFSEKIRKWNRQSKKYPHFRVPFICEKRRNDDAIAIVYPDQSIRIESMAQHLSKCSKSTERTIKATEI